MQGAHQVTPDRHLRGSVRGGLDAELEDSADVGSRERAAILLAQRSEIGWRRFQGRGCRTVADALGAMADGAIGGVHLLAGGWGGGLNRHGLDFRCCLLSGC
jgi:hypothetical protein